MSVINEIKKSLYKEKPYAIHISTDKRYKYYETSIKDGYVVYFEVPIEETVDEDGNDIFSETMEAQLLIRWLKE